MAHSVVSGVAMRLADLLAQEANFLSGVSDQVQQLQTELRRMQCFLKDADARKDESEVISQWVAEIRDLAYDAEDIIGAYVVKVASKGEEAYKKSSRESPIGGEPSSLKDRQQEQRPTCSYHERDVVGLEDAVNKLVTFLLKEEEGKRVASICGMGGLGKTTLARMVYHHHKVKQHFHCRAWAYISQQCKKRQVWQGILISLLSPSGGQRDEILKLTETELFERLCQVQLEQKCLVMLDDIWINDAWDNLRDAFPWKETNSKILLTSRNKEVALYVDPRGFHHDLQCLNNQRSKELLEKGAISWREVTNNIYPTLHYYYY